MAQLVAFSALLSGCSTMHYPVESASTAATAVSARYRVPDLRPEAGDEVLVFVSFSGGGMRAAALAYVVAEALDEVRYERAGISTSLLQEVDIVTRVSGGSLFAGWLGAEGAGGLHGFQQVLDRGLADAMLRKWLTPRGLWVSASSYYGRGDLLQEVLDEQVFHGQTIGDLIARGRRPLLAIRATDMTAGTAFDFTQETFDTICADVSSVPLSRAVASSMAVPVLFSPLTFQGYGANCPVKSKDTSLDPRKFIHLVDGGLVDNLGVRGPVDYIDSAGGFANASRRNGLLGHRHILYVVVNSETVTSHAQDEDGRTPSVLQSLQAWIDVPISRSTHENLNLLRERVSQWKQDLSSIHGEESDSFHYVEVNFRSAETTAELSALNAIPTSLSIQRSDLELLRRHARYQLSHSEQFQELIRALGATWTQGTPAEDGINLLGRSK